jgi:GAF domain-containing protein
MTEALIAAIREAHIRVGDSVVGETALRRAPVQVPDVLDAPGYALAPVLSEAGFHALLALPLLRAERVIGALGVRRRAAGAFGADTLDLLQTFASHSALAIQNAQLFEELEHKSQQLEVASLHKSRFLHRADQRRHLRRGLRADTRGARARGQERPPPAGLDQRRA